MPPRTRQFQRTLLDWLRGEYRGEASRLSFGSVVDRLIPCR